jgi:hypothetical protein
MKLTREEEGEAFFFQARALREFRHHPPESFRDLAWCVAVLAVRDAKPKTRGAKLKWTAELRILLVSEIEEALRRNGQQSSDPKAVVNVIAALRCRHSFWKQFSDDRLRKAYYKDRKFGLFWLDIFAKLASQ